MTEESAEAGGETRRRFEDPLPDGTDVLIVGGGIAGCSALHHLARRGIATTLVERHELGGGATGAAVGVLSPPVRQPFHETLHRRGDATARRIWEFALRSVRGLGEALTEMGAAEEAGLDLAGGHVLAEAHTEHEVRRSFEALAEAGMPVEWIEATAVRELTGGRGFTGGYRLEGGGAVDARPAAIALARAARERGARVVEGVDVRAVERKGDGLLCRSDRGDVSCRMVVYATHVDSRRFSRLLGDEVVPIRGQAVMLKAPAGLRAAGGYATHWKLNVWRQTSRGELVIGGWRHDAWDRAYWKSTPEVDERLQADLVTWFRSTFADWGELRVLRRWSGIFGWTADYLPLVGPLPGTADELVISGFSGGGLPFAFECGEVLAAAVAGEEPPEGAELMSPRRFV